MPLTPKELLAKVKAVESHLCVKQEGRSTLVILSSLCGTSSHYVRMPNEVWLHFLHRQIEALPADTPVCAGDTEPGSLLPPPDASPEETSSNPAVPGDAAPGEQHD